MIYSSAIIDPGHAGFAYVFNYAIGDCVTRIGQPIDTPATILHTNVRRGGGFDGTKLIGLEFRYADASPAEIERAKLALSFDFYYGDRLLLRCGLNTDERFFLHHRIDTNIGTKPHLGKIVCHKMLKSDRPLIVTAKFVTE